jgi:hypothetical protein
MLYYSKNRKNTGLGPSLDCWNRGEEKYLMAEQADGVASTE